MVEAFSEKCVKDVTAVMAECAGVEFYRESSVIRQAGWRAVYGEENKKEKPFCKLAGRRHADTESLFHQKGRPSPSRYIPKPPCCPQWKRRAKEIEDDALRQAMKDCGISTPPRASIIETLFKRGYMERCRNCLSHRKGACTQFRGEDDAHRRCRHDRRMGEGTGTHRAWGLSADTFRKDKAAYTREITSNCSHATNSSAAAIPVARVPSAARAGCGSRQGGTLRQHGVRASRVRLKAGRTLSGAMKSKTCSPKGIPSCSKASRANRARASMPSSPLTGNITRRSCSRRLKRARNFQDGRNSINFATCSE